MACLKNQPENDMENTHYWNHDHINPDNWSRIKKLADSIIGQAIAEGIQLRYEIHNTHIRLNGMRDEYHKTFILESKGAKFSFCKTAYKPYDKVVVALLIAAESVLPSDEYEWSSDREGEAHAEGRALYEAAKAAVGDEPEAMSDETLKAITYRRNQCIAGWELPESALPQLHKDRNALLDEVNRLRQLLHWG